MFPSRLTEPHFGDERNAGILIGLYNAGPHLLSPSQTGFERLIESFELLTILQQN
jgi:hypothetical protein